MWSSLGYPTEDEEERRRNAEDLSDEEVLEKLRAHPEWKRRMVSLLLSVEDESGQMREADAAEMQFIEQIRQMGREALTAWAPRQVLQASREVRQCGSVWREGKKNGAGTPRLGKSVWKSRNIALEASDSALCRSRQGPSPGLFAAFATRAH